jgi:hypothetical protein
VSERTPVSLCPHCGVPVDAATPEDIMNEGRKPSPKDLSICFTCGGMCVYQDDLTLRALTDEELEKIKEKDLRTYKIMMDCSKKIKDYRESNKLTHESLMKIFIYCLWTSDEIKALGLSLEGTDIPPGSIVVHMMVNAFCFHPDRIKDSRVLIRNMLMELPEQFREDSGGGMSFIEGIRTKNGELWGDHRAVEVLFALGMAAGFMEECAPREMWPALPGGIPYYRFLNKKVIQ